MPIEGGLRGKLGVGTKLVARYKGVEHTVEVVSNEDGKPRYRLADGREFKSPSAAGSAVMNGQAANGWRFWSVAEVAPDSPAPRPKCAKCGKQFVGAAQLAYHAANAERLCRLD